MKKTTTIISICLSIAFLNGQDFSFPQDSASWTYLYRGVDGGQFYINGILTINLYGDTTLNGQDYNLITATEADCYEVHASNYKDFIRTEGQQVYILYKDSTEEQLLYDFSLEEGDTVAVDNYGCMYLDSFLVVESVDEMMLNGESHKVINFQSASWVEGIGNFFVVSVTHPVYGSSAQLDPDWYELLCFSQNGEQIFADTFVYQKNKFAPVEYWSCDGLILATDDPTPYKDLVLSPNPTTSNFRISFKDEDRSIRRIQVFDLLGREVFARDYAGYSSIEVAAAGWPPGLYIVVVNERWVGKVVEN